MPLVATGQRKGEVEKFMQDQTTTLDREEKFAALAPVYLELHLPLHSALEAARADLQQFVRPTAEAIAEAA